MKEKKKKSYNIKKVEIIIPSHPFLSFFLFFFLFQWNYKFFMVDPNRAFAAKENILAVKNIQSYKVLLRATTHENGFVAVDRLNLYDDIPKELLKPSIEQADENGVNHIHPVKNHRKR